MMKILIVDDAADTRTLVRILLEKNGWEVIEAEDGEAACRILDSTDIRMVITDWMMPGMNGLSLLKWIRARDTSQYIYTILMTSRDQESDCVEGFSAGADDFITKPLSPGILYARVGVAKRILDSQEELLNEQVHLIESRDLVTRAYNDVQADLESAAAVQKSQLPNNGLLSEMVSSAWCYRPAMGISGDYLDVFQVGEDRLFFYLLDVSGHGVTAALRSAAISQLLRPISAIMDGLNEHGPAHVARKLNVHLSKSNHDMDYFATLVLGDLDASTGRLRVTSAGHPAPLLIRQDSGAMEIQAGGLPLGIDPDAIYSHQEIRLSPTDSLLLYSDGLLDCEDHLGRPYGKDALMQQARALAGHDLNEFLSRLEGELDQWRTGTPLNDDLSLLMLKYTPGNPAKAGTTKEQQRCMSA